MPVLVISSDRVECRSRTTVVALVMSLALSLALVSAARAQAPASSKDERVREQQASPPIETPEPDTEETAGDYIIGPDDVLSVVFWRDPQLSGDVLVRPDGKISLPLLDDIQAAGLTPKQLRKRLVRDARHFTSNPVASVAVKETRSRKVYITGQVLRPGQYAMTSFMTVLQLIATAGGLTDYAKAKDIRVLRMEQGQPVMLRFDYTKVSDADGPAPNRELRAGDTVVVP